MTRTSIRLGLISAAAAVAAFALAGTGSATTPVTVGYLQCVNLGGDVTVPAGSDVVVRIGWAENNRGRVQYFINDQTSTATINGTPSDVSGLWSSPEARPALSVWSTVLAAPVGTLAAAGDSLTVGLQVNLQHLIPEGKDPDTGEHLSSGPGDLLRPGTCTITAV